MERGHIWQDRRSLLALALLLWATSSLAVHRSQDGTGQVLLFPLYSVEGPDETLEGQNDTLISLTNLGETRKAVRINFREGLNGQLTLALNVYLGRRDTWVAALTSEARTTPSGIRRQGVLLTQPDACGETVAFRPGTGELFHASQRRRINLTVRFDDVTSPAVPERDTVGFFEVIELASFPAETDPCWDLDGIPTDIEPFGPQPPTGDLTGRTSIINVNRGVDFAIEPVAIDGFFSSESGGHLYALPDQAVGLDMAQFNRRGDPVPSEVILDGKLIRSTWSRPVDAVSAVLMAEHLQSEFLVAAPMAAATEWVVSFPTKHFYVNGVEAMAPFGSVFGEIDRPDLTNAAEPSRLTVGAPTRFSVFNYGGREGQADGLSGQKCTPAVSVSSDTYTIRQVSTLRFAEVWWEVDPEDRSPALLARDWSGMPNQLRTFNQCVDYLSGDRFELGIGPDSGFATINLDIFGEGSGFQSSGAYVYDAGHRLVSDEGHVYRGLPAFGVSVWQVLNDTLIDANQRPIRSNYGAAQPLIRRPAIDINP